VRALRIGVGLVMLVAGVALAFSPGVVADALNRPPADAGQAINLRASWGGSLAGLGAFVVACSSLRPWRRALAILVVCTMTGVGAARALGFVLDGSPDGKQWVWLVAEAVLVLAAGAWLVRRRSVH
jgi:hypothetical protein